jgi:hypothetical protein
MCDNKWHASFRAIIAGAAAPVEPVPAQTYLGPAVALAFVPPAMYAGGPAWNGQAVQGPYSASPHQYSEQGHFFQGYTLQGAAYPAQDGAHVWAAGGYQEGVESVAGTRQAAPGGAGPALTLPGARY